MLMLARPSRPATAAREPGLSFMRTANTVLSPTSNPFRFSTKYQDDETDFLYYGYRYYNPTLGRCLSRDVIHERGGCNLHAFVGNRPTGKYDNLCNYAAPPERKDLCRDPCGFLIHSGAADEGLLGLVACCNGKKYACSKPPPYPSLEEPNGYQHNPGVRSPARRASL